MASMLTSSYAFGSIIDIYNFDSTTGAALGIGSPTRGKSHSIIQRAQLKLSSILQTYFYNLAPSPWSPPTIFLSLHRSLEALEDILHQLERYDVDSGLGILGLVTHGLFDLLQEVELLLMSSRVDGPRDEAWWERFAKELQDTENSATGESQAIRQARDNIDYFVWAGKWILRVSVHGEYTRRISAAGDKLETMLVKLCNQQLDLYVWDGADGEEEFNITQRFSELAMYEGECFVKKVKLEAGLRVWMNWASKAVIGLEHIAITQTVPAGAYLDLLKAAWLFKVLRGDQRLENASDELRAVVSLVCYDLMYTLKNLQEQWLAAPDMDALISDGEWRILLQSGFEEWELDTPESQLSTEDIQAQIRKELDQTPTAGFRYSPIIMRDDTDESDLEQYTPNLNTKAPLPLDTYHHLQEDSGSETSSSYQSSHNSIGSLYSDVSLPSDVTEEYSDHGFEGQGSPDIRAMMSPAAVPGSEYEMYEPVDPASWDEHEYTTNGAKAPIADDAIVTSATLFPFNNLRTETTSPLGNIPKPWTETPRSGSPVGHGNGRSRTPNGSRFHEHFSRELTGKVLPQIPDIHVGGTGSRTGSRTGSPEPNASPLVPPPPIKDPSGKLEPTHALAPKPSLRFPHRAPVGGTMSSAGGRSSAAPIDRSGTVVSRKPSAAVRPATADKGASDSTHLFPPKSETAAGATSAPATHGAALSVPGLGLAAKESSRAIPAPLQLPKKSPNPITKAIKSARADYHEKGGWSGLLTPGLGSSTGRDKPSQHLGLQSGGLQTSRKINDFPKVPIAPLTVESGEVVAVNKEVKKTIDKNCISSPTPDNVVAPANSQTIHHEPSKTKSPSSTSKTGTVSKKALKKATKPTPRVLKNTAARATAKEKGAGYDAQPGEVEILPIEFSDMNALASDTGLPSGKWEECVIRLFRAQDGKFRVVTFRDGHVDEEYINSSQVELVPEYAHHVHEIVPILFLRRRADKKADNDHEDDKRRGSVRSSFGCVGDGSGQGVKRMGAETFYYRFRRVDDMFNFQLAWLGEMVKTDIPAVKCIRFKKGFVGSESVTARARVQIWKDVPGFQEHGQIGMKTTRNKITSTRIVMYWDEMICTTFITENLDIEAKTKSFTLRLKPSSRRPAFNNSIKARIFGQSFIATPATIVPGQISASTSGAVNIERDAAGGFSDEEQFDDFKWFEIEFYVEEEMKWFYQDFMRCQKERIREMRVLGSGDAGHEQRK